ncbi:MAG: copper resistance protein NlpE [Bacteroidetes bacterium]|nr:MAG: copper resistance protein NlpE [Bacteroidota bacterium]
MKQLTLMISALLLFALLSCTFGNTHRNKEQLSQEIPPDKSNARNSLDYLGTYFGVLPCADCEGISTTIQLLPDQNYVLSYLYKGKEPRNFFEQRGTWSWEDDNTTITLDNREKPNQYKVVENALIHLDKNGKIITGELAEHYRLKKEQTE